MKLLMTMMRLRGQQQQHPKNKKKKHPCRRLASSWGIAATSWTTTLIIVALVAVPLYKVNALISTTNSQQRGVLRVATRRTTTTRTALVSVPWRTTTTTTTTKCSSATCSSKSRIQRQQQQQNPIFWSRSSYCNIKAPLFLSGGTTAMTALPRWFASSSSSNDDDGRSRSTNKLSSSKEIKKKSVRFFSWPTTTTLKRSDQTFSSSSSSLSITTRRSSCWGHSLATKSLLSLSSLSMSVSDNDDDKDTSSSSSGNEFPFDIKTASGLVGGQSMLIVVGVLIAYALKTPNFGFGTTFALLNTKAMYTGFIYTIPLVILAIVLEYVEDYIPALQDVSLATQRSVLLLLGGTFRPVIGTITALLLGLAAGIGEELIFRGIFQYELAQRISIVTNWSWLSSLSSSLLFGLTNSQTLAIIVSSLVFGGLHAVTKWYAILATLASLYFGFMFASTGNLAVPIICHALYDIGALLYAHWTVSQLSPQEQQKVADWDG